MAQRRQASLLDGRTPVRLARNVVGTALCASTLGIAHEATAQDASQADAQGQAHVRAPEQSQGTDFNLPAISVDGAAPATQGSGYRAANPALGKLTRPLLDTPQSVSVLPRQLLDDQGVVTLRDALRDVPGVSLAAGEGGQQGDNLSIRGFNAQNDFYLDGIRDFGSYFRDPFDLESVEVLKGPSSVLFGRGSTGGIINEVSKQPQLVPVTAGTVTFGTDGTKRSTADVDRAIPSLPGTAVRLNAMVDENGVAGRDSAKYRRFGLAPSVSFGLGTDTRVKVNYLHQQSYDTPDYGIPWLNGRPAPVSSSNFYGYSDSDFFRTNVDVVTARVEHDLAANVTVSNQLRYGSYERDLRVIEPLITGYSASQDFVPARVPLSTVQVTRHVIGLSSRETTLDDETDATIHLRTGILEHTIVTGIEVARQTSDPTRYNVSLTRTGLLFPDSSTPYTLSLSPTSISGVVANDYAVYATDTVKLGPQFDLTGGWRFDRYDSEYHQDYPRLHATRDDDLPTWRAALVYKPVRNASVYASYGTSFDPSAEALSLSVSTAAAAPEKSRNYEVGGKLDLMDGRLSLTTAFYDLAKTNVRETSLVDPTTSILAGNYRVLGMEFGATGRLTQRLQVFGGYSYNDAEVVASPNPAELRHAPPNAPRHTLSSFLDYHLPWRGIEVGGGVNYVSSRTASSLPVTGTTTIERAPGYVLGQLFLKAPITPRLVAQLNVTNVNNATYYDGLHPGHIIVGAARTALLTLSAKL